MTNINLLDWRDKRRVIQNNKFFVLLGGVVLSSIILALLVDVVANAFIDGLKKDIEFLTTEISSVEQKIKQIKDLEEQKDLLLTRREVIDSLQNSRTFTVKIFDSLPRIVPNGVVINEVSRKGDEIVLSGVGDSNSAISVLMKNVQRLRLVQSATLSEIKSSNQDDAKKSKSKNSDKKMSIDSKVAFQLKITLVSTEVKEPEDAKDNKKLAPVGGKNIPPAPVPKGKK